MLSEVMGEGTTGNQKNTMTIKNYEDLIKIKKFEDLFEYLKVPGLVGDFTFGGHRYLNQQLYRSPEWKKVRMETILRDNGCDLAHPDHPIYGKVFIHHIEPITYNDILNRDSKIFDLENLVCVTFETHNALHYGDASLLQKEFMERTKNDTCPWR